jgi:hypothetical protein
MKCFYWLLLQAAVAFCVQAQSGKPYLSNLAATKDDPVYTTYAAALNRSEFIVDKGYQFTWYDSVKGVNFESDKAGDLCLGFKLNGKVRFQLNQFYRPPVITASYSDLVQFHFYPFKNIRVEVFFLVHSSRIAVEDVTVTNEDSSLAQMSIYPFFHHKNDVGTDLALTPEGDGFTFRHREHPDTWTIDHRIPFQVDYLNAYVIDSPADAYGGYSETGTLSPMGSTLPSIRVSAAQCVESGMVYHADGSPCTHLPPLAQQIVLHNDSDVEILTEEAPKGGTPGRNITGSGWQSCELGNFKDPPIAEGDSFLVVFTCVATGQQGMGRGVIPALPTPGEVQVDIQLRERNHPSIPTSVSAHFSQNNASAIVQWSAIPGYSYSVHRRTGSSPGRYDRVADDLTSPGYLDIGLNRDSTYGYVVVANDSTGRRSGHSAEVGNIRTPSMDFISDVLNASLSNSIPRGSIKVAALQRNFTLKPGQSARTRIIRGVTEGNSSPNSLIATCRSLRGIDMQQFVRADEQTYSRIPRMAMSNRDHEMVYWNAFSLLRQCMLPPEGQCSYNYYVFSREPQWGWGHGGQVFHESLAMLAYAYMDPLSATNSQRVFLERQQADGYINYRTGPYLNETIPYNGKMTTSAPWLSWENWELYKIHKDETFLNDAYKSGKKFYQYWQNNRDADNDGLCEWGGHAVLECVRDGKVAVWDQVGWPSNFECLDLNAMLVKESRSLALMAEVLGDSSGFAHWMQETKARADLINRYMWDLSTGFYYHVDKADHDFSFRASNDLTRMEIIGFLPLWAGIASKEQAAKLVQNLLDPTKFWRRFGVPTLSASDGYYNPVGYWNGPVWVQWQYLIFRGLLDYGYKDEARQLAEKVLEAVIHELKTDHCFWELYSPDDHRVGWNKTYIWTGIVARMLIDLQNLSTGVSEESKQEFPKVYQLKQNYPNPFNSRTSIAFALPLAARVTVSVFNVLGQEVKTLTDSAFDSGDHTLFWDGTDNSGKTVGSGVYLCTMKSGFFHQTRKISLVH